MGILWRLDIKVACCEAILSLRALFDVLLGPS